MKRIVNQPWGAVPRAVVRDRAVKIAGVRVYTALSAYQGGNDEAWPSVEAIAEWCGVTERTVKKGLQELREAGWIESRRRFGASSVYRVFNAVESNVESVEGEHSVPDDGEHSIPDGGEHSMYDIQQQEKTPLKTPGSVSESGYLKAWSERARTRGNRMYPEDFARFWKAYPRKVNKSGAFRKWIATLRAADDMVRAADEMIRAAENYADEKDGTDERYIKHAATFLGPDEHWRDWVKLAPADGAGDMFDPDELDELLG